jgi:death-on-curing family protein
LPDLEYEAATLTRGQIAVAQLDYYPILSDVLAIGAAAADERNENPPILMDGGREKLESALATPQWAALHDQADLLMQATLMTIRIAQAHAVIDGNKRLAYLVGTTFLRMNGYPLPADQTDRFGELIVEVLEKATTIEQVAAWLRQVCVAEVV